MPLRSEEPDQDLPTLVFVRERTSGPSRRMESLVAWIRVTQKKRLRVVDVEADLNPAVVEKLGVTQLPALVLLSYGKVVGKLEGRVKGHEIERLINRVIPR